MYNNSFVWKVEKLLNTIFQRMFVFRFLLVLFVVRDRDLRHQRVKSLGGYKENIHRSVLYQQSFYPSIFNVTKINSISETLMKQFE